MHEGKWNGLGGKLLPGETPEECVVREVEEESGLKIKKHELKGLLTFPSFNGEDWYVFVFVANSFEGTIRQTDEGTLSWIDNKNILELNLWEGDRIFIPHLDKKGFFSGKFIYDNGTLISHTIVEHN